MTKPLTYPKPPVELPLRLDTDPPPQPGYGVCGALADERDEARAVGGHVQGLRRECRDPAAPPREAEGAGVIPMEQYKSARADAEHIAALVRSALTRAGISDDEAGKVRPLVTATGRAYVQFGALPLRDAAKLLEALALSRPAPHGAEGPTLPAEALG